jgi:hypothetical protein
MRTDQYITCKRQPDGHMIGLQPGSRDTKIEHSALRLANQNPSQGKGRSIALPQDIIFAFDALQTPREE